MHFGWDRGKGDYGAIEKISLAVLPIPPMTNRLKMKSREMCKV